MNPLRSTDSEMAKMRDWLKANRPKPGETPIGLGDKVHRVLGPVGALIRWPCMKGDGTIDLKPGSPCDNGRTFLNELPAKISEKLHL